MSTQLTEHDIKRNTGLLIQASAQGNVNEVIRLIPISNPKADSCNAFRVAARMGHIECVKLLFPSSDSESYETVLRLAAYYGYTEIVELLIPVTDCKAEDSLALKCAAYNEHENIIKLLIPFSDWNKVMRQMRYDDCDTTLFQQCLDEYETMQQKERLTLETNEIILSKHASIKRKI